MLTWINCHNFWKRENNINRLTHWNLNKMAEILQTTFSNTFSWLYNITSDLIQNLTEICSLNCISGPVFCLFLKVSSDYAQPITGQVTEVTCPVIGRAQPELTLSKRQKTGPDLLQVSVSTVASVPVSFRYKNLITTLKKLLKQRKILSMAIRFYLLLRKLQKSIEVSHTWHRHYSLQRNHAKYISYQKKKILSEIIYDLCITWETQWGPDG